MRLYLDANIIIPLFVLELRSEAIHRWFRSLEHPPLVSDLAFAEVGSAMSRRVRVGELQGDAADALLAAFDGWAEDTTERIETTAGDVRRAAEFVRRPMPKLLTPDAIHLATCQRLGLTLVTLDADLVANARVRGVEVVVPT